MRASFLARELNARLLGDDVELSGVNKLASAFLHELSFIIWPQDVRWARASKAGAIVCELGIAVDHGDQFETSLIAVDDIGEAYLSIKSLFAKKALKLEGKVSSSARLAGTATIGMATIGADSEVSAYAVIGDGARIGKGCAIGPGAVIHEDAVIGDRVTIGAHSVIGGPAFVPFGTDPCFVPPSMGGVRIDDDVRIGALCTIDRGFLGNTLIGAHSLIDNSVHIGHDVEIGRNVVVAAQSGFAGFVSVGDHVTFGGQIGVAPHVAIAQGARISGKSAVHCDVKEHEIWSGNPAMPHAVYLRSYGAIMNKFRTGK